MQDSDVLKAIAIFVCKVPESEFTELENFQNKIK